MINVVTYDQSLKQAKSAVVKAFSRLKKAEKRGKVYEIAEKIGTSPALIFAYARGEGTNLRRYLEILEAY